MSEINVTSKTQRLVVDSPTKTVSVINSGPMGPGVGGPGGGVGASQEDMDAAELAIAQLEANGLVYASDISQIQTDVASNDADISNLQVGVSANASAIANNVSDIAGLEAANFSRVQMFSGYRFYDATRGPGSFTLTLPSTIRGYSVSGADFVFMSITTVTTLGGYVSVRPYNSTTYSFSVVNNDSSGGLSNGACAVPIDSSRRFTANHNTSSFRGIYDVWGLGWY